MTAVRQDGSARYGHAFFGGVPTVIETADPKLTCAPASGLWFITVPRWPQELSTAVLTVPSTRPTACRAWLAWELVSPHDLHSVPPQPEKVTLRNAGPAAVP